MDPEQTNDDDDLTGKSPNELALILVKYMRKHIEAEDEVRQAESTLLEAQREVARIKKQTDLIHHRLEESIVTSITEG